jgi:hypothetical protein
LAIKSSAAGYRCEDSYQIIKMQKHTEEKTWHGAKEQFWRIQLGVLVYNVYRSEIKSLFKSAKSIRSRNMVRLSEPFLELLSVSKKQAENFNCFSLNQDRQKI